LPLNTSVMASDHPRCRYQKVTVSILMICCQIHEQSEQMHGAEPQFGEVGITISIPIDEAKSSALGNNNNILMILIPCFWNIITIRPFSSIRSGSTRISSFINPLNKQVKEENLCPAELEFQLYRFDNCPHVMSKAVVEIEQIIFADEETQTKPRQEQILYKDPY